MREALNQWHFVIAVYAIGVPGMLALTGWAWGSMKRAEKRRDEARGK